MSLHSFDPAIAQRVGTSAATVYENLCYWTEKNRANGKHNYDGQTWTYNSISAFAKLFPYLTKDQIRGALKKLITEGLIAKGNYNKAGYDRTLWYAVKSQMHLVKIPNGVGENPKPIPDNKPNNKPIPPPARESRLKPDLPRETFCRAVMARWNTMAADNGYATMDRLTQPRLRFIRTRLAECDGEEAKLLEVIDRVPKMSSWRGGGKRDHITFDWVFGPPKNDKPDRFLSAQEYNPTTEIHDTKARHDQSRKNPNAKPTQAEIVADRRARRAEILRERRGGTEGYGPSEHMDAEGGGGIQLRLISGPS